MNIHSCPLLRRSTSSQLALNGRSSSISLKIRLCDHRWKTDKEREREWGIEGIRETDTQVCATNKPG